MIEKKQNKNHLYLTDKAIDKKAEMWNLLRASTQMESRAEVYFRLDRNPETGQGL